MDFKLRQEQPGGSRTTTRRRIYCRIYWPPLAPELEALEREVAQELPLAQEPLLEAELEVPLERAPLLEPEQELRYLFSQHQSPLT